MSGLPESIRWLFWEVDFEAIDVDHDTDYILARVLERGRMMDVRWAMQQFGMDRIHAFFRDVGHPEISERTLAFWRTVLDAEGESWVERPAWRTSNDVPWLD